MTSTEKVIQKARSVIEASPSGRRYSELVSEISTSYPGIPINTIHGALHKFRLELPADIYQPNKGLYRMVMYRDEAESLEAREARQVGKKKVREEDFYDAFGDWLVNELEECTKCISVGGSRFKDKWGTPDVIGVREARRSDIIKPPTEIVSAEIKLDPTNLITAFGQACSYRLFSHKSYIVVPSTSSEDDIARLDALSRIFGIGLVLFDPADPESPNFQIRSRAAREEPDMFYVNRNLDIIEDELFT